MPRCPRSRRRYPLLAQRLVMLKIVENAFSISLGSAIWATKVMVTIYSAFLKPQRFLSGWYSVKVPLHDVAAKGALAAPIGRRPQIHSSYLLRGPVIYPQFYFISFVTLDEAGELLDVLKNSRPLHLKQTLFNDLLILRTQNKILPRLERLDQLAGLVRNEFLSRRPVMDMHYFEHFVVRILVVLVAYCDPQNILLDVYPLDHVP